MVVIDERMGKTKYWGKVEKDMEDYMRIQGGKGEINELD